MNKFVTFLLGMLFGIIFVFGALFGAGFYLYKKGNIEMFTKQEIEGLGDFNTMTVEEIINLVISMVDDSQAKGSLGYLKATYNLDIDKLLDPEGLKEGLFDYFNDLNIGYLMNGDVMGFLGTVKLGIGFAFAGDMVSPGGVSLLREKSLADILEGEDILSNLVSVFSGVRLGAFLGGDYSETLNEDHVYQYEYIGEGEGGLFALLANCELSAVLKIVLGQSGIFEEIKAGGLSELGSLAFSDLLSSTDFGELLEGKTLGDLIEEEEGEYTLQFMSLLDGIYIGKLLGYTQEGDDWTKGEGEAVTGIELALARIDIGSLLDDFSIDSIIDGLFLGDLMGYAKGELTEDSCQPDCDNEEEGHQHTYKYEWTSNGNPVSGIEAQLANFDLSALLNDFSIDALLGDMLLGDIMGYYLEGNIWYNNETDKVPITGIEKALADTSIGDLLEDFDVTNILGDVYLGDIMDYEQVYTCDHEEVEEHEHSEECPYFWADKDGNPLSGIEKALADTSIGDLLEDFDVTNILGDVYLGDIMGYYLEGDIWYNNETDKVPITGIEKALADTLMGDLLEDFDVTNILGDVYLGNIMGYTQGELTDDSCPEGCTEHETGEHIVKYKWTKLVEGEGEEQDITGIEFALANTLMGDLLEDFNVKNILGDVYLGEIMGHKQIYTCGHEEEGHIHSDECSYFWADKEDKPLSDIEEVLANTLMRNILEDFDIKSVLGDVYLGGVMDYTLTYTCTNTDEDHNHSIEECPHKWEKDDKTVEGIEARLADIKMSELLNDGLDINKILGDMYLGEIMGFTQGDLTDDSCPQDCASAHEHIVKYKWTKPVEGEGEEQDITGIELALANTKMSALLNGGFNIDDILGDMYLGEIMGFTQGDLTDDSCPQDCASTHEHIVKYKWTKPVEGEGEEQDITGIELALANTKMSALLNGGFNIDDILGDMYLGEIMGFTQGALTDDSCPQDCASTHEHIVKYKWTKPVEGAEEGEEIKGIELALANTQMSALLNGGFNIDDILGDMYLGEIMGYTPTYTCPNTDEDHTHSMEECSHKWEKDDKTVEGIEARLADVKMSELLNDGLDISKILGSMFLGEVMGFTQGDLTDDSCPEDCASAHEHIVKYKWTKPVEGAEEGEEIKGIELALANTQMSALLNGDFNIDDILGDMYLGEVMGYTLTYACPNTDEDHNHSIEECPHKWEKDDKTVEGIEARLADVKMSELLNDGLDISKILGSMFLGEVMGFTQGDLTDDSCPEGCTEHGADGHIVKYKWTKPVEGAEEGEEIKGIELALANTQMSALLSGDFNIDDVLGDMYIGEVMGYTQGGETGGTCDPNCTIDHGGSGHNYKEYEWYEADGTSVTDKITLIMCNMVMTQMLNGDIDLKDKVLNLTLKDLLDVEGNTILELLADTPVNDLGSSLDELYIGQIMGLTLSYNNCPKGAEEGHVHTIIDNDGDEIDDTCPHMWLTEVKDISSYSDVAGQEGVKSEGGEYIKEYEGLWYEAEFDGETYNYNDVNSITKAMADTLVGGVDSISSRLTGAVSKASVGELMEMGVLSFEEDTMDTLDIFFCRTYANPIMAKMYHEAGHCDTLEDGTDRAYWMSLQLPEFLNQLIEKMGSAFD